MSEQLTLTVNGIKRTVTVDGHEKLIDILRDKLELTGTKRGCDDVSCGACIVVVNGDAKKSCNFPLRKLKDADIVTIEGLASGTELHPIQKALIESGAVQCGYCIPGIVMELYALYTRNVNASEQEIIDVLEGHLCRCTGYEPILAGAKLAQQYMQ